MHIRAGDHNRLIAAIAFRCLQLAKDYLIVPGRLHRWCMVGVLCGIGIIFGCFIAYAFVEKYQLVDNFFYGQVKFSFIDRGYPEFFGYGLELSACALFMMFAFAHHKKCWYAWAAILFVVFLDDAFKLHETIGHAVSAAWNLQPVAGDLVGFASTGLFCVIFWFFGVRTISDEEDFSAYLVFSVYFAMLIFFGVGVDAVHGLMGKNVSQTLFTLLEDGGELITTAVIALSALGMWLRQKHAIVTPPIHIDSALPKPRILK
jgi:hypothetical protein